MALYGRKFSDLVPEKEIDYDAIYSRGGANLGDEDFALFKCPNCFCVYLLEYEVDTLYLDGNDLSRRAACSSSSVECGSCNELIPNDGPWIGPDQLSKFAVTWSELQRSDWHWIVPQRIWEKCSE